MPLSPIPCLRKSLGAKLGASIGATYLSVLGRLILRLLLGLLRLRRLLRLRLIDVLGLWVLIARLFHCLVEPVLIQAGLVERIAAAAMRQRERCGDADILGFILMLGITMIAAPGVPGGAIMAAVGLLGSMLGFDTDQVALMIAAYIAIDSFGTACNVTGDGAISLVIHKLAKGHIDRAAQEEDSDGLEFIAADVRASEGT